MFMRVFSSLTMLVILLMFNPSDVLAASKVGAVGDIVGTILVKRDGTSVQLDESSEILLHDVVLTDEGDYVEIIFDDDSYIALSGDGEFSINDYAYVEDDPAKSKADFGVVTSTFKYVSGKIGKQNADNVKMELDFVSIGIRGTTIYRTMDEGDCLIFLEEGQIVVENNAGSVLMNPLDGTRAGSKDVAPTEPKKWSDERIAFIKGKAHKPE